MESALAKRHEPAQARTLLVALTRARWPHVGVPPALRLPLPWISWLIIAAIIVTGLPGAIARGGPSGLIWVKVALFAAILVVQLLMARNPGRTLIRTNFALVAAVIVVSSWAIR
jgi:hypothetical protein